MQIKDKYFRTLINQVTLESKICSLGYELTEAYQDKNPIFIAILNGSFMFAAELMKSVDILAEITFLRVSSYQATESTGEITEILGLTQSIEGRHVVILEDIIDTGITMHQVKEQLLAQNPASLAIATMLFKPAALQRPLTVEYIGFEIAPLFVIGYGLDYDGYGRNLPEILVLAEK